MQLSYYFHGMKAKEKSNQSILPETNDLDKSLENIPAKFGEMNDKDLQALLDAGFRNKQHP